MKRIFITTEQKKYLESSIRKLMEENKFVLTEENGRQKRIIVSYIKNYSAYFIRSYLDTPLKELPSDLKRGLTNNRGEDEGLFGQVANNQHGCNKLIDFLRINLLQQVGIHRNEGPLQYIEGICRILLKELGYYSFSQDDMDGGGIVKFCRIIKLIYNRPQLFLGDDILDENLNGMTYEDFIKHFEPRFKNYKKYINNELNKNPEFLTGNSYKVIPINDIISDYGQVKLSRKSENFLNSLSQYTDWCICGDMGQYEYEQYISAGGKFYICLKDGFENIQPGPEEDRPMDEYGLSMLAVLVAPDGLPDQITTRWNHDFGGENHSKMWEATHLQALLKVSYYSIFKPRDKEDLVKMHINNEINEGAEPESDEYKIGFEDGGFQPYGHIDENLENELTAWHGSNADFDAFDTNFMGKGEGSQVYGWGIYVSDNQDTGKLYARNVSASKISNGNQYNINDKEHLYGSPWAYFMKMFMSTKDGECTLNELNNKFHEQLEHDLSIKFQEGKDIEFYKKYEEESKKVNIDEKSLMGLMNFIRFLMQKHNEFIASIAGNVLYQVDIPDDNGNNYIDWSSWDDDVYELMYSTGLKLCDKYSPDFSSYYENCFQSNLQTNRYEKGPFNGIIYETVCETLEECHVNDNYTERIDKLLSLALNEQGITGFKVPIGYRHQGGIGKGYNYIIFDARDVKIVNKDINKGISLNESVSAKEFDLKSSIKSIAKFMREQGLNVYPYPKVELNWEDQDGLFIKTGYYNPTEKKVVVFCTGRHPKDILRTFSHEMIHHSQNLNGKDLNFNTTNVKDDDRLEKIESEAYVKGNIYFRKWTEYQNSKKSLNESIENNQYASAASYIFGRDNNQNWYVLAGQRLSYGNTGKWNVPTGMVEDSDNTIKDCAIREIQEETGLNLSSEYFKDCGDEPWTDRYGIRQIGKNFIVILENTINNYSIGNGDGENSQFQWIPINKVNTLNWAWNSNNTILRLFDGEIKTLSETVSPSSINLSSFKVKKELNPKFWKNEKIDSRIRLKLLDIADDFIDFLDVDWVKPKDIIMTGSLANFNWDKKYSDIDLHILMDFSKVDKRTDFVKNYFDSKKKLWNEEHKGLNIYGFTVEVYVQDINEKTVSTGVFSLDKNKWIEEPEQDNMSSIRIDKNTIQKETAKYVDKIEELISSYKNGAKNEFTARKINEKAESLFDDIKNERTKGLDTPKKELSNGNIVFKYLRRMGYIDKLVNLQSETYDKMNSI